MLQVALDHGCKSPDWITPFFWCMPDGFATLIAGTLALTAGVLAWLGIQAQISAQTAADNARATAESRELKQALTAELLALSSATIASASNWNERAHANGALEAFPMFVEPHVYRSVVGQLGKLGVDWPVLAVITFYGNLLDLNDMSRENAAGRPTFGETSRTIARRIGIMCSNLAEAISGLNNEREFPILPELDFQNLITPDGRRIGQHALPAPRTLQGVLFRLAGRIHPSDSPPPVRNILDDVIIA